MNIIFSKIIRLFSHISNYINNKDIYGKKYKKCIMLYGYYAMNLGDDLFFEKLFNRYPNVMFFVYDCAYDYTPLMLKHPNMKFFNKEDSLVRKINNIGEKLKVFDLFERLLLLKSSATIHLGGSIYQQFDNYLIDYDIRKKRKQRFKSFYSLSCNFGTFYSEDFFELWKKQFVKYNDICFRDKYSCQLFNDLNNVRYAPDLMFSFEKDDTSEGRGIVAISVIDPYVESRIIAKENSDAYKSSLLKTIYDLISGGYEIVLLGFCTFEGDNRFIEILRENLSEIETKRINYINYSFDNKDKIIDVLANADYIIGTRLHSIILSIAMGKRVLPIIYNQKANNVLTDINYNGPVVEMDNIRQFENIGFQSLLENVKPFTLPFNKEDALLQFEKLDLFLNKKR